MRPEWNNRDVVSQRTRPFVPPVCVMSETSWRGVCVFFGGGEERLCETSGINDAIYIVCNDTTLHVLIQFGRGDTGVNSLNDFL